MVLLRSNPRFGPIFRPSGVIEVISALKNDRVVLLRSFPCLKKGTEWCYWSHFCTKKDWVVLLRSCRCYIAQNYRCYSHPPVNKNYHTSVKIEKLAFTKIWINYKNIHIIIREKMKFLQNNRQLQKYTKHYLNRFFI